MDGDLSFEEHIPLKVKKANVVMGQIRRSFSFLDGSMFKKLYFTFVRPQLEYAVAVWAPHLYINIIENVQICATELVDGFSQLDYSERLRRLDIPTLIYRRARGDMIEIFKHFHSYDKNTLPNSFQPRDRISRKLTFRLHERRPKDGVRGIQSNFLYFRSARIWNELPKNVVNSKCSITSENNLDKHWKNGVPEEHPNEIRV